jgi:hypothetical protein
MTPKEICSEFQRRTLALGYWHGLARRPRRQPCASASIAARELNEAFRRLFWFHQLDMAVALVGSSREATKVYYSHFLSHWSYNKNLWSNEELEIYTDNYRKPGNIQGGFNTYRGFAGWTDLDKKVSNVRMTFFVRTRRHGSFTEMGVSYPTILYQLYLGVGSGLRAFHDARET